MKDNNFFNQLNDFLLFILNLFKISIILIIIILFYNIYSNVVSIPNYFKSKKDLPSYKMENIKISIDNNFNKNSKSIFQKINERFFNSDLQVVKVIKNKDITIIIDGSLDILSRNILIKKELCFIYTEKLDKELDLNNKRNLQTLKELFCY